MTVVEKTEASTICTTEDFIKFLADYEDIGKIGGSLSSVVAMVGGIDLLLSTKPHKHHAVDKALKYMQIPRRLVRAPIGHIDEPNHIKQSAGLLRGKSDISVAQFARDYPAVGNLLSWFKDLDITCFIQDVRPKAGKQGSSLKGLTNPTSDVVETYDIHRYVASGFDHGKVPTVVRIENLYERPVVKGAGKGSVIWSYPYKPVVSATYFNYANNPLGTSEQIDIFLELCRMMPKNKHNERNYMTAGGLLNEILVLSALLAGNQIQAVVPKGVIDRTRELSVRTLLESIYPMALINLIGNYMGVDVDRMNDSLVWEKVRDFATLAIVARDFAVGGSFDGVWAAMQQNRSSTSISPEAAIDMKPNYTIIV